MKNNLKNKACHCFYSSLSDILSDKNISVAEYKLYFLLGINPKVSRFSFDINNKQMLYFMPYDELINNFLDIFNCKAEYIKHIKDPVNYFSMHKNDLVMICTDLRALTYHSVQINMANDHYFTVSGYDKETGNIKITDKYVLNNTGQVNTYQDKMCIRDRI